MFAFGWSSCGRKPEYPEETHLSDLVTTWPSHMPTPGIEPRSQRWETSALTLRQPNSQDYLLCWIKLIMPLFSFQADGKDEIWFNFQKTKYMFDPEVNTFVTLTFPVSNTIATYLESKGLQEEEEIKQTENIYGKNS